MVLPSWKVRYKTSLYFFLKLFIIFIKWEEIMSDKLKQLKKAIKSGKYDWKD